MQPSPDQYQVSRRPLDVEDYIDILRRHKSWIIGPAFAGLVLAVVTAFLWPDSYVSEAKIRVVPPAASEKIITPVVAESMAQRVNTTAQSVESRSRLQDLITTMDLYPKQRKHQPLEDVIEQMRKDIQISGVAAVTQSGEHAQQVPAFKISFKYENRLVAQKVVAKLVSQFLDENQREGSSQSTQVTQFLRDQADQARKHVEAVEAEITKFKLQNNGRLPEQVAVNQQQLSTLQSQLDSANAQLNRATQNRLLIETQLQSAQARRRGLKPPADEATAVGKSDQLQQQDRMIAMAETELANLRERYRDNHPDVQRQMATVAALRKTRDEMAKSEPAAKSELSPLALQLRRQYERDVQDTDAEVQRLQSILKVNSADAEDAQRKIDRLSAEIRGYQSRIDSIPVGEGRYQDLLQERQLAKEKYEEFNRKLNASLVAQQAGERAQMETMEQLDAPSLPQAPVEPKRSVIVAFGLGVGLLVGFCLAGAREVKDTSLKNLKDVRAYTQLNVLGSIPLLENDLIVRRRRRMAWLAWTTACLVGCLIMSGTVLYYYTKKV